MMYANCEENPEQNRILRQLKDMFSSVPYWRLREVCKSNNWNLEICIDQLMNIVANNPSSNIKGQQQQQQQNRQQQQQANINRKDIGRVTFTKDEERVGSLIKKGYRVMILMRGPPGVGKSYLARSLVENFVDLDDGYSTADFICSTDDYFYDAKGVYKYNPANLSDAHEFNHQRVANKAKSGLSPIVVDNTNMQLWEMLPYVKQAVQNNYLIEIVEPKTSWRNSTRTLAQKNKHGVAPNRIQQIMDKYEKCSVATLTRMLKNTKYTKPLPQMRLLPPLRSLNAELSNQQNDEYAEDIDQKENSFKKDEPQVGYFFPSNEPKEQRTKFGSDNKSPSQSIEQSQSPPTQATRDVYSLLEQKAATVWKPFETESVDFWGIKQTPQVEQQLSNETNNNVEKSGKKSLLDLLKENTEESAREEDTERDTKIASNDNSSFERHSIDCPNENETFVTLRQVYPNKRVSGLWDLFVKCNGDVDWAADILLREDELERIRGDDDDLNYQPADDEVYECLCNNSNPNEEIIPEVHKSNSEGNVNKNFEKILSILNTVEAKPQRQRSRSARTNQMTTNPALLEVKESIENCFVLGDDQYSSHLLKIRNYRSGLNTDVNASLNTTADSNETLKPHDVAMLINKKEDGGGGGGADYNTMEDDDDDVDDDEDKDMNDFNEDMLEMSLGEQLIQQLVDTFKNESSLEEHISSKMPLNVKVFMPRSLAKQLYMLWVESAYNHMEEERQKLVQEDEDFARLLKNPKYAEFKQSPSNLREILDMEYAWNIYNQDKQENIENLAIPTDLATHLTQMKLCETFPDIPRETLLDILASNGNDYNATVSVLRSTMQNEEATTTQAQLLECALQEQNLINQQVQTQLDKRQERSLNNWDDDDHKSPFIPEEAKRLALREFEESRNLAAHHCQLKAECYQKAKEAIQSGNGGVALYYSQIANLHKKKIDMYNHRAANCIVDVHKYTQNNPDLLDLHYLHLIEALGCLDLFLDRHITGLRVASRNYKHVFIITGRGKHSTGGVSTIKNKVKARLKERCLRWSEVNPGLLKVKIFSGSRHSKNI